MKCKSLTNLINYLINKLILRYRLKAEELEKKLEEETKKRMETEHREEQLLKRITEKDKAYTKLQ